eukprot:scaffold61010_cov51-Phaeocystis_antarctica.AAC.1
MYHSTSCPPSPPATTTMRSTGGTRSTCRRAGKHSHGKYSHGMYGDLPEGWSLPVLTDILPQCYPGESPIGAYVGTTGARLYGGGALSVTWRDQGWGNRKGHVYARLTAADGNGLYWAFRDNTPSGLTFRDNVQG